MGATYDFTGRRALVTGGASGIGLAAAQRLSTAGARVAVLDRETPDGDWLALEADVADSAQVNEAVRKAEAELGGLDILVNSAGVPGESVRTADTPDEEWRHVMSVNADGTFYVCRAVIPGMVERGYGRIVLLSSIAGKDGNPMAPAYSASKAAVIGLTKALGKDLAQTGVLVNCIAPAVIETPILDGLSEEHVGYMVERIPLGRTGTAEEVAALICWLASDECTFSTGAVYDISGGRAVY
ncbi:MAG TPA: SDR family NAD(P)-dependent oxidoreductase [Gaiellaceae bacterium]|nr:SDR family NAD(P)-dependent oxidoreductase [Gaiellaceae bacterium]